MTRRILTTLLLLLLAPAAMAQTGKHVALGASIGVSSYADRSFRSSNPDFSPAYRLSLKTSRKSGWSWSLKSGLGWSRRDVSQDIGGEDTQLGKLQMGYVMGGVQRVLRGGPLEVGAGIEAGPSFNHFDVDQGARDAFQNRLLVPLDDIKVENSVAIRPDVSAWYDLGPRLAIGGSMSYTINRPRVQTTAGGVTTTSTWKTDHANASVGFVVGMF